MDFVKIMVPLLETYYSSSEHQDAKVYSCSRIIFRLYQRFKLNLEIHHNASYNERMELFRNNSSFFVTNWFLAFGDDDGFNPSRTISKCEIDDPEVKNCSIQLAKKKRKIYLYPIWKINFQKL